MIRRAHGKDCLCDTCLVCDTYAIISTILENISGDMERLSHGQLVYLLKMSKVYLESLQQVIEETRKE